MTQYTQNIISTCVVVAQLCLTLCNPTDCQASLPLLSPGVCSNSCPFEYVMPSNHLILYRPLLLLPSVFPRIRVFSNESALPIRSPKYWSFSFNNSPSNEHSGLISFQKDWFDLLASKGLSRVFSSTTVQKHQFLALNFIFQLSHPSMTTGKP